MNATNKSLAAATLAAVFSLSGFGAAGAVEQHALSGTIMPIAGPGAAANQHYLHNVTIGSKQVVSYFQSEVGVCKLTLMVGDAFNGEDTPDMTTVRFETSVSPGKSTRFGTANGEGLEFTCQDQAQSVRIRALDQIAHK